jgi:hypothetical protein
MIPPMINNQLPENATPLETTPHIYAHMGGNHVIGFNNSREADSDGNLLVC